VAIDPIVGVIFQRDAHPAAKTLEDLTDPLKNGAVLCDEHMPLSEAFAREWVQDAHVILYRLVDEDGDAVYARASKKSPLPLQLVKAGGRVEVSVLLLDHDLPEHREWEPGEALRWLESVPAGAPSPSAWYTTLHGSRLVYVLSRPVGPTEAEALATALVERWKAAGLPLLGAAQCTDWTRLFRLPRTRRSDTGRPFHTDPRFIFVDGGPELDVDTFGTATVAPAAPAAYEAPVPYEGMQPTELECARLLHGRGANGHRTVTDFAKDAKRYLKGRESFGVCFEEKPLDTSRGWNVSVLSLVGQVVSMTAHLDTASPEACFALVRPALEQLSSRDEEGRKDWLAIGWDMVCRMWAVESAKLAAERAKLEAEIQEGERIRTELATQAKAERPSDVPDDPEEAKKWLARQMIASDGTRHYIMRPDGSYNLNAVGDSMLIPMIRELGMESAIDTKELRGHSFVYRSVQHILSDHATPVSSVRCSSREPAAYIDGSQGAKTLHVPIHRLNPRLSPARSDEVEEWLVALFGEHAEVGLDWIAHALDVANPICALNLYGAPGAGKGMLVQGLAECFEGETFSDGRALDRFNIGLLKSPILVCDEGVPQIKGLGTTADQIFRTLVTGGPMSLEGKMRDIITADIYPRILFTSNDRNIMRSIVGHRDLTEDDVRAIEVRLLSIETGTAARRLLTAKGNRKYTRGWVGGEGRSNYVVANHIAWMFHTRKPSRSSSGRLLVEGESSTELVRDLRLRSDGAQVVLRVLTKMLESPAERRGLHVAEGRAFVTVSAVVEFAEHMGIPHKLTLPQTSQILRQFSAERLAAESYVPVSKPASAPEKGRWIELDLAMLLEEALRYGITCDRIETMVRLNNPGDAGLARAAAQK